MFFLCNYVSICKRSGLGADSARNDSMPFFETTYPTFSTGKVFDFHFFFSKSSTFAFKISSLIAMLSFRTSLNRRRRALSSWGSFDSLNRFLHPGRSLLSNISKKKFLRVHNIITVRDSMDFLLTSTCFFRPTIDLIILLLSFNDKTLLKKIWLEQCVRIRLTPMQKWLSSSDDLVLLIAW